MSWRRHVPWVIGAGFAVLVACTTEHGTDRPETLGRVRPAVVERSAPAKQLSRAACEALHERARAQQRDFDAAHLACARDADCAYPSECTCTPGCPAPIAKNALPEREALRLALEAEACTPWRAGGCPETAPVPVPSCVMAGPKCEAGRCTGGRP